MRRFLACLALLGLALPATTARAGGVNMRWTRCYGDGGVLNRTFACASNVGTNLLVGSFVLDAPLAQVSANEMWIDITTAAGTLPAWWQFKNAGSCRSTSLAFNTAANPNDVVCADWAQGMASGGIGLYTVGTQGPNTAQIRAILAVPPAGAMDLVPGQEYFSFNITINNAKTAGATSCSGCQIPACLALSSMKVYFGDGGNSTVTLTNPAVGPNSNYVSWQNGDGIVPFANGTCAGFDTAGFAVNTSAIGRGTVARSRIKAGYPAGSPLSLSALPLPGDRFVAWSGDTTTTQDTLDIVVTRPLSYLATFAKDPAAAPHAVAVADYPGDEGSRVLVTWDASPLDTANPGFLVAYLIQRQPLSPPGAAWTADQTYTAVVVPHYQLSAGTLTDSTAADPANYRFRVVALASSDTLQWVSNEVEGHSVDNVAPPAPASVTGTISSGIATFFWPAVNVPDLDHYAIYRALEPTPPTDAAHRIGTTTLTGFSDAPGYFAHYLVTAVDVHGNEGAATALVPSNTTGTDGRPVPGALTVGNPTPSPMAGSMSMSLGLPHDMHVTVDVVDAQGRLLRRLNDGVATAGWLTVSWDAHDAQGHQAPAGIYFVRVRTPAGQRIRRLALLP